MKYMKYLMSLVLLLILAGCGASQATVDQSKVAALKSTSASTTGTVLKNIQEKKTLVLGTSADYAPFEWHDLSDGQDKIVGFDIAIAQEIANELGVTLEVKDMNFDSLVAAVKTGKVDMVMAGMNATDERKKEVDFSDSYYKTVFSTLVRKEDADKYTTFESLKGVNVGVQKGTVPETLLTEEFGSDAKLTAMAKNDALVAALVGGKVDAIVINDKIVADNFASLNPTLMVTGIQVPQDVPGSAVAIQKGNDDFVAKVNEVIAKLQADGGLDKLMLEYVQKMGDQ